MTIGCRPDWRCLRFGCQRCDRERERERLRREPWRDMFRPLTKREQRLVREATRPPDDPNLN